MTNKKNNVVALKADSKKRISSTEKIWGKPVTGHGYAAVPSILLKSQRRLGINATQMNIIIQLLEYWYDPTRPPFPTKKQLAERMGVHPKTIQLNIRELEQAGYIKREKQKTASGDWGSNIYHLGGLVAKIKALEPEFTQARKEKAAITKKTETPKGRRTA
ncbi:MAG: helix-turn-helix domain-containing protein [Pseudomonadota bacterium]